MSAADAEWDVRNVMWRYIQQRVREGREQKRAQLDERHDYMLSIVAEHLALELTNVEDAILEGSQVIAYDDSYYYFKPLVV